MASSLLVLLADVEASIQKVQGALHCEEDAYRHEIDMASILDGDEFELVQELADACLLAVGAGVDHVVIPEQAPVESTSLVDEIQELEILLGELLPKANPDENDDDVDGGSTASTVSSCSSISSSSATPEPDPTTPRQADMNSPNRKKRNRQAGSRRRHEHRAMWDCFERSCLQTHADRHRVARLYRHEAQVKVQKCVRARLQTASNRQAKPLELLPPPPRASQYLDKYHQTPLTTKRRTWARSTLPAPTGTPSTLNDPVSILVSVYLNDNRDTMTRLYAHSWGDLQAKARYKLQVGNDTFDQWLREAAHINHADGRYNKFVVIESFSQLRHGDILCAIHAKTYQHTPHRLSRHELLKRHSTFSSSLKSRPKVVDTSTRPAMSPRWDYNGRPVGL